MGGGRRGAPPPHPTDHPPRPPPPPPPPAPAPARGGGVAYLHLIPFYLFGGDLLASEMARQLVSIIAALAMFAGFFRAWTGSWRDGLPFTVVALIMVISLHVDALLFPINSMLGLRSTMPLVVAIHLYLRPDGRRASVERAALFAIAMLCGIEQGTATIMAFVVVKAILALRRRNAGELLGAAATVALGGFFFVLILFVMTPTGFASVIRFNFRSLPNDQFWYFGGPPNRFLFRWVQLRIPLADPLWTVGVFGMVGWVLVRFWRGAKVPDAARSCRRRISRDIRGRVDGVDSGCSRDRLPSAGGAGCAHPRPARGAARVGALETTTSRSPKRSETAPSDIRRVRDGTVYTIAAAPGPALSVIRTPFHLVYAHGYLHRSPEMSATWGEAIQLGERMVDNRRAALHRQPTIWSTYASNLEWKLGVFHPSFDYIIHALGPDNRAAYAATFVARKPDIVQTIEPTFTMYEEWLELNHWDFYRPLLRDYAMASAGPWSYYWFRRATPFDERARLIADAPVPPGRLAIAIDARDVAKDSIGLFEVTLHYHVVNPWRRVPVIGSLPRYLVSILEAENHSAISLAPYAHQRAFPIVTTGPTQILPCRYRAGAHRWRVTGVRLLRVVRLAVAPENQRWAMDFIKGPRPDTVVARPDSLAAPPKFGGAQASMTSHAPARPPLDVRAIRVSLVPISPGSIPWFVNLVRAMSSRSTGGH